MLLAMEETPDIAELQEIIEATLTRFDAWAIGARNFEERRLLVALPKSGRGDTYMCLFRAMILARVDKVDPA
jgi:hypothetical protein